MALLRGVGSITHLGREAARMVLPSRCIVCGENLPWRARQASCCNRCWAELPRINGAQCSRCGLPLPGDEGEGSCCIGCTARPPLLDWCSAWGTYERGLERVLHAFKFERHDFLAAPLAGLLAPRVAEASAAVEVITAIPMHASKIRHRGYNQSLLLAREVGRLTGFRVDPGLLRKVRNNATQSTLARSERARNVKGVFVADSRCEERSVLVIDDISTTGETLREAATELKRCGASRVTAMIIARVSDSRQ